MRLWLEVFDRCRAHAARSINKKVNTSTAIAMLNPSSPPAVVFDEEVSKDSRWVVLDEVVSRDGTDVLREDVLIENELEIRVVLVIELVIRG